ncbi:cystathionine beta-lyase [Microvirga sp. VF16]|uniref:cystathionine beta-lyase n=1 Tax=Microvirga sp. VF16 TaxID=2807101 RepID=UPI00193D5A88|nr:cystathionine beta-lyase [Microvirga sp. VF16]QRM35283.1 cystathionine beta-lyase [Microvirga sp. VF16]
MRTETTLVHPPRTADEPFQTLTVPLHHASTVTFETMAAFESRHERLYDGYSYGLYGTPTSRSLEQQIAALEGGTRALITPSGLSAISLVCMAFAQKDDRILMPSSMYGPARTMAQRLLAPLGIDTAFYDPTIASSVGDLLDDRTKLVWVESPGSVTFEVQDIPAISAAAHARGILVAADNTWATPILFNPLAHGVDLSMQSLSKYASGHSDLNMGSIAVREEALFRRLKDVARFLGLGVGADECFLCMRGLVTLPLRLRQSEQSSLQILEWLRDQDDVVQILHPAEPNHPGHAVWTRDFRGSSGVFSIVMAPHSADVIERAFQELRLFKIGASWGGAHSLVAPSNPRSGRDDLAWLPAGHLIRLSIGLENVADLIEDLQRFFGALGATPTNKRRFHTNLGVSSAE